MQLLRDMLLSELYGQAWAKEYPLLANNISKCNSKVTVGHILDRYNSFFSIKVPLKGKITIVKAFEVFLMNIKNFVPPAIAMQTEFKIEKNKFKSDCYSFNKIYIKALRNVESDDKVDSFDVVIADKYAQLIRSAHARTLPFNLTVADVRRLLSRKTCVYSGKLFDSTPNQKHSRTIDRIDCSKGYVKGNVVACTFEMNLFKEKLFEHKDVEVKSVQRMLNVLLKI